MKKLFKQKLKIVFFIVCAIIFLFFIYAIYIPKSPSDSPLVVYTIQKGMNSKSIAFDLESQGIINNSLFFRAYVIIFGQWPSLQAGSYDVSPSMSISSIVKKFVSGDVKKIYITIIEGWNLQDISEYFEKEKLYLKTDFLDLTNPSTSSGQGKDWSQDIDFLKDKPKNLTLEGYIFPDTYQIAFGLTLDKLLETILDNFDKKLTQELRKEISLQKKSIFQIITMASIIEKEVILLEDKKIVAGILWKRINAGIPLQVDATINYITGKNDPGVSIKDTTIDSPYNTYKYYGLPKGPISNPGMDSILAAIYPTKTDYWYYLSADDTGKTIFSKTLDEHNIAIAKYLRN